MEYYLTTMVVDSSIASAHLSHVSLMKLEMFELIEAKRPLGRRRRRWEDNIRMDLEEMGINAGNWVDSAQDRDYWRALVNAALNLRVP